jgi:hypothetical protein
MPNLFRHLLSSEPQINQIFLITQIFNSRHLAAVKNIPRHFSTKNATPLIKGNCFSSSPFVKGGHCVAMAKYGFITQFAKGKLHITRGGSPPICFLQIAYKRRFFMAVYSRKIKNDFIKYFLKKNVYLYKLDLVAI